MGALVFTGAGNSRAPVTATPAVTSVPFTAAGWVRPTSFATLGVAFYLGNKIASGNDAHRVVLGDDGTARANSRNSTGTGGTAISANSMTLNAWSHIGAVFSANNARRIMLNGSVADARSNGTVGNVSTPADGLCLGAEQTAANIFGANANAMLENWAVWNVALTDDELVQLAQGVPAIKVRPTALRHWWWRMGRLQVSSTVPDIMGRNPLTAVNTTTSAECPIQQGRASILQETWRPGPPFSKKRVYFLW